MSMQETYNLLIESIAKLEAIKANLAHDVPTSIIKPDTSIVEATVGPDISDDAATIWEACQRFPNLHTVKLTGVKHVEDLGRWASNLLIRSTCSTCLTSSIIRQAANLTFEKLRIEQCAIWSNCVSLTFLDCGIYDLDVENVDDDNIERIDFHDGYVTECDLSDVVTLRFDNVSIQGDFNISNSDSLQLNGVCTFEESNVALTNVVDASFGDSKFEDSRVKLVGCDDTLFNNGEMHDFELNRENCTSVVMIACTTKNASIPSDVEQYDSRGARY